MNTVREQEQKLMKDAIHAQRANVVAQDDAFWGWIDKEKQQDGKPRGQYIQELLTNVVPDKKESKAYSVLLNMNDVSKRFSLVAMYAINKGMTLDEVLSDEPSLNERKAEIGKEFFSKMKFEDQKEYADKKKNDYLKNDKNKTRIEAICERWLTAMEKDGPNAKKPPRFLGDSDQIAFFHKKCQDFILKSGSGESKQTKAEFIEEMKTAGQAEYVNQHDFGKGYKSFVDEHTYNVSQIFIEMHNAFTNISADFLKDTDIPSLANNIQKIAFVTQVSHDLEECRHDEVSAASFDEDEYTNEIDQKEQRAAEIRELDVFMKHCNYIASDKYALAHEATTDEMKAISDAYWTKTQVDAIAEKISKAATIGETADEMKTYNVGRIVEKQEKAFKAAMDKFDDNSKEWVAKANEYIGSGEHPMHAEKEGGMSFVIYHAEEDWKDFETFDMEDGKVKEESVRTMSWKELEAEEKKAKGISKKQERTAHVREAVKDNQKEKEKEVPKLIKGGKV